MRDQAVIDDSLIEYVVRTIADKFQPERIVLFGSHARGTAGPDSDLDIFVEMNSSAWPHERARQIRDVFGLYSWPMDIVVYTPQEVREHRGRFGSLLQVIEREGKTVYARR